MGRLRLIVAARRAIFFLATEPFSPPNLRDRIKCNSELAFLVATASAHGLSFPGQAELAEAAWSRLGRGDAFVELARRRPGLPGLALAYHPFAELGLRNPAAEAAFVVDADALSCPLDIIVRAARGDSQESALALALARLDLGALSVRDSYLYLHAVLHVWRGRQVGRADAAAVARLAAVVGARALAHGNVDLAAEAVFVWFLAGAPPRALLELILGAQRVNGAFPTFVGVAPPDDRRQAFPYVYHPTIAAALALLAAAHSP